MRFAEAEQRWARTPSDGRHTAMAAQTVHWTRQLTEGSFVPLVCSFFNADDDIGVIFEWLVLVGWSVGWLLDLLYLVVLSRFFSSRLGQAVDGGMRGNSI